MLIDFVKIDRMMPEEIYKNYKQAFATESGKVVLSDLAARFKFLQSSFTGNVNEAVFNEGQRNVVLYLLHMINTDLDAIRAEGQSTED